MLRDNLEFNKTVKPNSDFLRELKQKLPEFFTAEQYNEDGDLVKESSFDIEKFKVALQEQNINELSSGYQLDFIGKNYAKKQSGERPTTVIVPDNAHNSKTENVSSKNIFLTGDNLEVLRHLQQNYTNSIDVIYIDPPYNTGNGDFIYPDEFEYSDEALITMFGLNDDELQRLKAIQGKSTHSAWLTFMYPRLYMAKKILKESGFIFISIDDNEYSGLKAILDEIFGEINHVSTLIWEKKKKPSFLNNNMGSKSEYIVCYARNKNLTIPMSVDTTTQGKKYPINNAGNKLSVIEFPSNTVTFTNIENQRIDPQDMSKENIITELLDSVYIKNHRNQNAFRLKGEWRYSQETLNEIFKSNEEITISKIPFRPNHVKAGGEIKKIHNLLTVHHYGIGTNEDATEELKKLLGEDIFDYPKPSETIKFLIKSVTYASDNYTILDFFAGSGTTAHATMQLNSEDGGKRRFIMCTLPEPTFSVNSDGSEQPTKGGKVAYEAGYRSIDAISRERICRAAAKIQEENPLLSDSQDFGFKHYRVVAPTQETMESIEYSNSMQLDLFDDMISKFSSESLGVDGQASGQDTILQTYLVKDGYKFDAKVEWLDIDGVKVPYIEGQRLYIISSSWETQNTRALINAIGTNQIRVQTIVVYGHSIEMARYRELEIALAQLEIRPNLQVRY